MTIIKIRADQLVAGDVLCQGPADGPHGFRRRDWPTGTVLSVQIGTPTRGLDDPVIVNRGAHSPLVLEKDRMVYVDRG